MKKTLLIIICVIFFFTGCKEEYEPNIISPHTGYLVVEGLINSGNEITTITLSRTVRLVDSVFYKPESKAQVVVEGDNSDRFVLTENNPGSYRSAQPLPLKAGSRYRLKISAQGSEFVSEYTPVNNTPPIDSISWKKENEGVQIYVNAHDDRADQKSYFRWEFNETWEIKSNFLSNLKIQYDRDGQPEKVVYKYPNQAFDFSIYRCWQSARSSNLLLGSTEKLSSNVIYLPINFIQPRSIKLGVLYSIEIKQYGLSKKAYDFYLQMKKNTEQLGSIFDPQPSELNSNIKNVNDPAEVVIGFVEVSGVVSKRIFIRPHEVNWLYSMYCEQISVKNIADSIKAYGGYIPVSPEKGIEDKIDTYYAAQAQCVDCTLRGSNQKPSFWPN